MSNSGGGGGRRARSLRRSSEGGNVDDVTGRTLGRGEANRGGPSMVMVVDGVDRIMDAGGECSRV